MPIASKLGSVVTHYEGLLLTISHNHLRSRGFEITGQTKNIISPLPQ